MQAARPFLTPLALLALWPAPLDAQTAARVWATRYNAPNQGNDFPGAVVVDGAGHAIVTGASDSGASFDFYTAKYAAATGALLWERRYNGSANQSDVAIAVAVDGAGDVAVTGNSYNASGNHDFVTAKYAAANGAELWRIRYNGPGNSVDQANAVAMDAGGNVIVGGYSFVSGGNNDYYTAKYAAASGALLWERRYNGPANGNDGLNSLTLDAAGNAIVTGLSSNGVNSDIYTAKYAAATGALLWERRYNGPANGNDGAYCVAVDAAGNVAIAGTSIGSGGNDDFYTAKYAAADGALLWEKRYNGPGNGHDISYGVAVDAAGHVAVTGQSRGLGNRDYYTAKYAAADGALLWEKRYNGPGNQDDIAYSVAMDAAGNVAVTGESYNGANYDYYTAKYAAADGTLLWEARYNGPDNRDDRIQVALPFPSKIALTADGGAIVTGESNNLFNLDYATVRYALLPPEAATSAPSAITADGATFHGTANPRGVAPATAFFEWTTDGVAWTATPTQAVSGSAPVAFSAAVLGLPAYGGFSYRAVAVSGGGTATGATLALAPSAHWRAAYGVASLAGDEDRDGRANVLEFALGSSPLTPDPGGAPGIFEEGGLRYLRLDFAYRGAPSDATIEVQAAGAASGPWTTVGTSVNGAAMSGLGVIPGGAANHAQVRDAVALGAAGQRFLKVKVTAGP